MPWIVLAVIVVLLLMMVRIVNQYERKVVLTFGKYTRVLTPGLNLIIPVMEQTIGVDIREKAVDVPSQEAMTKDNISCTINAVIYYRIKEDQVERAVLNVRNLDYAMTQFALTTMRNIVGQFELDELLAKREQAAMKIKAKIITSEGELASAENLTKAATMLSEAPGALHLRTLQSINDISSDQSNTTIWMIPVEVLEAMKGIASLAKK